MEPAAEPPFRTMLFTQAVVKTHNFQAPVNLSVPLREPHHCHGGHCPVFGAQLDLDPLPFNCCKTLIQPGIYLKRETHNHVQVKGFLDEGVEVMQLRSAWHYGKV